MNALVPFNRIANAVQYCHFTHGRKYSGRPWAAPELTGNTVGLQDSADGLGVPDSLTGFRWQFHFIQPVSHLAEAITAHAPAVHQADGVQFALVFYQAAISVLVISIRHLATAFALGLQVGHGR